MCFWPHTTQILDLRELNLLVRGLELSMAVSVAVAAVGREEVVLTGLKKSYARHAP